MSDHVEGLVAKITEKPTRNGGTIYNVCMDIDGEDEWFGYGFDKPDFSEGDEIEFDIKYNGDYTNIDPDTVNILSSAEPKQRSRGRSSGRSSGNSSSSRGSSRGGSRGSSRDSKPANKSRSKPADKSATMSKEEWAQKDKIIRRQACMNTAINLIGTAVKCELVALPTKKADKLDAFVALCDEEAVRLYDQYEEQVYGNATKKRGSSRGNDDYDDDIPE